MQYHPWMLIRPVLLVFVFLAIPAGDILSQGGYSLSKYYTLDKVELEIDFEVQDYDMVYPGVLVSTPGSGILFHLDTLDWIIPPSDELFCLGLETSKKDPTHIYALMTDEYSTASVWEFDLMTLPPRKRKVFEIDEILYPHFCSDQQGGIAISGMLDELWVVVNERSEIVFESDQPIVDLDFLISGALVVTRVHDILMLGDNIEVLMDANDLVLRKTDFFEQQIVVSTSYGIFQLTQKKEVKPIIKGPITNYTVSNGKLYTIDYNNDLLVISSYR